MKHYQSKAITLELAGSNTATLAAIHSACRSQRSPIVWRFERRPSRDLLLPVQSFHRRLVRCRALVQKADLHHRQQSGLSLIALNILAIRGTHEAWQAASKRLISLCNQVYGDFQSLAYSCLTVTYFYPTLSSSLAAHEGCTPKYQDLSRSVPERWPIAANRGTDRAA
jgi:hypothetical protein